MTNRPITAKYIALKTLVQVVVLTAVVFMLMTHAEMQGDTHFDFLILP